MGNLIQLQKNLSKLANKEYLIQMLFEAIRDTEEIALSLQKQQLGEGRNNEDESLGTYSRATELIYRFGDKKPRKPKIEGQLYNFEDTGDFFDDMYLLFGKDEVQFWSNDEKTPLLVEKYNNLLGLDDYNLRNYLKNSITPLLIIQVRKVLL